MSDFFYNKMDFLIIIVLALLVAFIIGFNIIKIIDSKLSSVTINVPTQNCQLPPIYLNLDKETGDIKQIKLNDVISTTSSETVLNSIENDNIDIINDIDDNDIDNINAKKNINSNTNIKENFDSSNSQQYLNDRIENFGGIQDYPLLYGDDHRYLIADTIVPNRSNAIIEQKTKYELAQDPNYSDINHLPLLFAPDTDVPNKAGPNSKGYYSSKVKLIEDPNSPLMKLAKDNLNKVNQAVAKCALASRNKIPEVNGTFDGYNAYADLRTDSFANVTSIGKSMLAPYTSFPVPS